MIVRIRLRKGAPIQRKHGKNRHLAMAGGALLRPAALMAYVLGFWRFAADLGFANPFAASTSTLSHWQVWIPAAALLHIAARMLDRYGRGDDLRFPFSTRYLSVSGTQTHTEQEQKRSSLHLVG